MGGGPIPGLGEDELRDLFEGLPDGLLVVDEAGTILEANAQAGWIFGYTPGELQGRNVDLLVPRSYRARHAAERDRFARSPRARPMGTGLELTGLRKDGEEIPLAISLRPFTGAAGLRVAAVVRDLREAHRLRAFRAAILRAAEEERRRIARELHDDTAQRLAALLLRLRISRRPESEEEWTALLAELREEIQDTAEGVRRIARNLRPPALEDAGVEAAVLGFLGGLEESWHGRVEVSLDPVGELLSEESRLVLYRVIQEACSNVVRHAGASLLRVEIQGPGPRAPEGAEVLAQVLDDGRGFDPEGEMALGGLGLTGMVERAGLVGGRLEIDSRPGRGTRVRLHLPVGPVEGGENG